MLYHFRQLPGLLLLALYAFCSFSACEEEPGEQTPSTEQIYFTQPADEIPAEQRVDTQLCHWLDQSSSSLDIAAFELDLPCVETSLIEAKKRGVSVRLVVDSENPSPELKAIAKAKIPIVGDERGAFMHNKFIVRDQQDVWTGSLNFTVSGVERNFNNALAFHSPEMARLYQAEFEEMFLEKSFGPRSPRQELPQLFELSWQGQPLKAEVLFSPEDPVRQRLSDVLKEAHKNIYFMAFSFTDDQLGKIILDKASKGVEVHGLFEKTGSGTKFSEYGVFKKNKLDVKTDGDGRIILHHKVFVIDEETVVTGSYNFSRNADRSNDENMLILHNSPLAQKYLEEFKRLYARAE